MKTRLFLFSFLLISQLSLLTAQVPQGFTYQAIARGTGGTEISNTPIQVKISILSDTTGFYSSGSGTYIWEELQSVTTNSGGMFTLIIGNPLATKVQGSAISFSSIDWKQKPLYIGTKINYSGWKNLGTSPLWTVPYSMVAGELEGAVNKLEVVGEDPMSDEALFEVKRKDGQTMFAVYNHGVRVYMPLDTLSKGRKGGFAIGGFSKAKGTIQDYFVVNPDSIRAYIDTNPAKARKGGFAIGGFDKAKAGNEEYLRVTRDSTRIYLNDTDTKARKGGFAIGGFDKAKGNIQDFMTVSQDSIRMYINDAPVKALKGGFAIGGFDKAKNGNASFLNVATESNGIINPSQNRILWYPLKNAFLTGRVLIEKPDSVGINSFSTGYESKAKGMYSQAMGYKAIAGGDYSTAIGKNANAKSGSFAFGDSTLALGANSYSFGYKAKSYGYDSYSFGSGSRAVGMRSFSFGSVARDSAGNLLAIPTTAIGESSLAFGLGSRSEGTGSISIGNSAFSTNKFAMALGFETKATGYSSLATGYKTESTNDFSYSAGYRTKATADYSVAMGAYSQGTGEASTAIGYDGLASGDFSFVQGIRAKAASYCSFAIGRYNISEGDKKIWVDADPLFIIGNGTYSTPRNAVTVLKNGNLGIGPNKPVSKLEVTEGTYRQIVANSWSEMSGSSNYGTSLFSSNAYVRNSNNAFIFSNTQPALGASGIAFNMPVWNSAGIFVNSAPSTAGATFTPNWIMTFLPNAVGIGTTSPSTKLHVNGDTRVGNTMIGSTYMRINQYGTGNRDAYVDLSGDDTYSLYGLRLGRYSSGISQIAHNGTGDFEFRSNNSAYIRFYVGTTKKFEMGTNTLINSNLSVGGYITSIGITNTGVISTYGTTGTSYSSVSAGSMVLKDDNPKIELYDMDTDGYTVLNKRIIAKNNNFYIENGSVSTTLLTITNTGRVGIGTTTPSYPLDIGTTVGAAFSYGYLNGSGNVGYITGGATNYYSIRTAGRITCPEFNANSDARIKQEVYYSDGESNLSLINNLKVAEFRFIDQVQNGSGKKQGFIAQDVEKVLPQAVSLTKDFIPDIYEGATDLQLLPAGKLKIYLKSIGKISVGDTLKMIVPSGDMIRTVETIQADGSFVVGDVKEAPVFLFVYGKLVNDFRSIDYNRLFTAGIGAIQELDRKRDIQQSEIEKVIEENSHLKAEIQSLRTEIEQIKAILLSGNR